MASLKGTQTEKNLLGAFAGESQARNRYTYFAGAARKEGSSRLPTFSKKPPTRKKSTPSGFSSSSKAARLKSSARFPAGVIGPTLDNLKAAAAGERFEHHRVYPGFAKVARAEGLRTSR